MPQITVDYSERLADGFDRPAFARFLHSAVVEIAAAKPPACKTRFRRTEEPVVGPDAEGHALVHVHIALLAGRTEIPVNSLHNQGIARLAPRLLAEGWAPDGTIEAVRVKDARGFALGVQWHPEYDWERDAVSRRLFEVFGQAAADWASRRTLAQAAE